MSSNMRVEARINLNNLVFNLEKMEENIGGNTPILAVIKTNAYGHGAIEIAQLLENKSYIYGYAVATIDEAVRLRKEGIRKPILIIGIVFNEDFDLLLSYDITCAVASIEQANALSVYAASKNQIAKIHVKLDTGMGRIGFPVNSQSLKEIVDINNLSGVKIEGMFTHFAKADELDKSYAHKQHAAYEKMRIALMTEGVEIPVCHCANSASILELPDFHMDMVRAGITMYGLWPSNEVDKSFQLKPVMSLVSHVSFVKKVPKDTAISYGGTYVTNKESVIATVPVGYGDGYPRSLSNKGYVLIHGKKAPIVGRVCMDQFMIDVTEFDNVVVGDEVVLMGTQKDTTITCEELGDLSGRFNYEFVCDINDRVPRKYIR